MDTSPEPNTPVESGRGVWCSLITVTYNSASALREFWGSAGTPPDGVEWIVVDNASTDGSAELARSLGARVVQQTHNLGFSASNNVGLTTAQGRFIGFVNPDIRVDFDDLPRLLSIAERDRAIVSPQLLNGDGSLQPNGRGFPFLIDKVKNRLFNDDRLHDSYLLYATSGERKVCWLMGAAVFGLRADIDLFGGWDDHFFLYYEDKDFSLRAWAAGIAVEVVSGVTWTHGWARETTSASATPWKREFSSMAKFYRRYPEFLLSRGGAARRHPQIQRAVFGTAR